MPSQAKPNVNTVWASGGLASPVDAAKQALGFVAEIPDYDDFNGMIQQISAFQKHVNQEGVPVYDALTQYYTSGFAKANGTIYVALQDTLGNAPPALNATNVYWRDLFARVKDFATDTGVANAYVGVYTPALVLVNGLQVGLKALNPNTGASTFNGVAVVGPGHTALQGGEIVATGLLVLEYNTSIGGGSWVLVASTGGALQVVSATKSQHATPLAQVQSLITNMQVVTVSTSFVVPANVTKLKYRAVGPGGGGGGSNAANSAAGGAGSGAYSEGVLAVTPGAVLTITLGAYGAQGTTGNGNTGGTTTIAGAGISVSVFTGGPSLGANGGTPIGGQGLGGSVSVTSGANVLAALNTQGAPGQAAFYGGGSGYFSGNGGNSVFGGGLPGGGGYPGAAFGAYGAGGAGGANSNFGGNGSPSVVILEW